MNLAAAILCVISYLALVTGDDSPKDNKYLLVTKRNPEYIFKDDSKFVKQDIRPKENKYLLVTKRNPEEIFKDGSKFVKQEILPTEDLFSNQALTLGEKKISSNYGGSNRKRIPGQHQKFGVTGHFGQYGNQGSRFPNQGYVSGVQHGFPGGSHHPNVIQSAGHSHVIPGQFGQPTVIVSGPHEHVHNSGHSGNFGRPISHHGNYGQQGGFPHRPHRPGQYFPDHSTNQIGFPGQSVGSHLSHQIGGLVGGLISSGLGSNSINRPGQFGHHSSGHRPGQFGHHSSSHRPGQFGHHSSSNRPGQFGHHNSGHRPFGTYHRSPVVGVPYGFYVL